MPQKISLAPALLCGAALAAATPAVFAQAFPTYDTVTLDGGGNADRGYVGGGLFAGPRYLGSDEYRVLPLPIAGYRWANGFFVGTGNGAGYNYSPRRGINMGARVTVDFGRRESASDALRGMGDINAHPEAGVYFNAALDAGMFVTTTLRYGAGGNGLISDLGFGWGTEVAPTWHLRLGVGATLANGSYMRDFFGVSAEQSARSGYAQYDASSGVRDVRGSISLGHPFSPTLVGYANVTVRSLRGDARQSPITQQATSGNLIVGLVYGF